MDTKMRRLVSCAKSRVSGVHSCQAVGLPMCERTYGLLLSPQRFLRETTRSAELAMVARVSLGVVLSTRRGRLLNLKNSLCAALNGGRDVYLSVEVNRDRAMAAHRCIKHQSVESAETMYLSLLNAHFQGEQLF